MTGTFRDQDVSCASAASRFDNGADEEWMRVDGGAGLEFHEVRLQEHASSGDVDSQLAKAARDEIGQPVVACRREDRYL